MGDDGTIMDFAVTQQTETTSRWTGADCSTIEPAEFDVPLARNASGEQKVQPKRRLRGWIIAFDEQEVRVMLIDGDKEYEYFLPARMLQKAKVTEVNQPFEMDELEEETANGFSTSYVFRPMADAKDTVTEVLANEDEEIIKLRQAALGYFKD